MKDRAVAVIIILFVISLIIGEAYVYLNGHNGHEVSAEITSDGHIAYEITGSASEYRYAVFTETKNIDVLYLYFDENHKYDPVETGAQKEFFSVISQMLEKRGVRTEYTDSEKLRDVMSDPKSSVFVISGALPDTVYGKSSVFEEWMTAGGTLYWSGPEVGRYVSSSDGIQDSGKGYFGGDVCDVPETYGHRASKMQEYTRTLYYGCLYGLKADRSDSKPLSFISKDGYSSVSVSKLLGGNITVFGGDITKTVTVSQDVTDRTCCADLIVCGLTYKSEGLETGHGTSPGMAYGVTDAVVTGKNDVAFFISTGSPASDWSKCIHF